MMNIRNSECPSRFKNVNRKTSRKKMLNGCTTYVLDFCYTLYVRIADLQLFIILLGLIKV